MAEDTISDCLIIDNIYRKSRSTYREEETDNLKHAMLSANAEAPAILISYRIEINMCGISATTYLPGMTTIEILLTITPFIECFAVILRKICKSIISPISILFIETFIRASLQTKTIFTLAYCTVSDSACLKEQP